MPSWNDQVEEFESSAGAFVVGIIFALAGAATWYVVEHQLAAEKITVSEDARFLAGRDVTGPFTAYAQADGFFRASLYTSVVAFGVAAMGSAARTGDSLG